MIYLIGSLRIGTIKKYLILRLKISTNGVSFHIYYRYYAQNTMTRKAVAQLA